MSRPQTICTLVLIALGACLSLPAWALPGLKVPRLHRKKTIEKVSLVESARYQPCGQNCTDRAEPITAVCLRSGNETWTAEARDLRLGDLEQMKGRELTLATGKYGFVIATAGLPSIHFGWSSRYEGFADAGCIAEVHIPILDAAARSRRPATVPAGAVAIVGPGTGEAHPEYLYYECSYEAAGPLIACHRWYENGRPYTDEWYCAATTDHAAVPATFALDAVTSQAGRLRLKSGGILQLDHRWRVEGILQHPGEGCR